MPRGMPYIGETFIVAPYNVVRAWREEKRRQNPNIKFTSDLRRKSAKKQRKSK